MISPTKIEKEILNYMVPLRYELFCHYVNQFSRDEIDFFMSYKGLQIFDWALLSEKTMEFMVQKVSLEVLRKNLQHNDYDILKTYLWCQKCRMTCETKEKRQKRIKIFKILLIIDKLGIQNFMKTNSEADFMTKEFIEEINMCLF